MIVNLSGPGASYDPPNVKRNPYDISTWGPECGRGMADAKGQDKPKSSGRKHRGSSSDDLAKSQARK